MSLHYTLSVAMDLRPDTPENVVNALQRLFHQESTDDFVMQHPEFDSDDGFHIGLEPTGSTHSWLQGVCIAEFKRDVYRFNEPFIKGGAEVRRDTLILRQAFIDDLLGDWLLFVVWLAQFSDTNGFVGYIQEEMDSAPTLIYFQNGAYTEVKAPMPSKLGGFWENKD